MTPHYTQKRSKDGTVYRISNPSFNCLCAIGAIGFDPAVAMKGQKLGPASNE